MTNWLDIGGGALLVLYAVALLAFDRFLSSRPSRDLLLGYLQSLKGGAGHQPPTDPDAKKGFDAIKDNINTEVTRITKGIEGADPDGFSRLFRPISVTKVLAGWRDAHRLEEQAWLLASSAELANRLRTGASELGTTNKASSAAPVAQSLAARITKAIDPPPSAQPQPKAVLKTGKWQFQRSGDDQRPSDGELRALTQETIRFLYDQRDTKFQSLASRQTQSVWLAVVGLALIVTASLTAHHQSLFVFGALGAFISRLGRVQSGVPKEDDYGVSSGTLYLSLPAGAIAGWVGVLVVNALALPSIRVLSGSFRGIWDSPTHILPAAIAVAFGFSERLLNRVLQQTAGTVSGSSSSSTAT
jgi:hypothetical protein